MCRSSESIGRDFIKGKKWFSCTPEFWSLINFFFHDVVPVHGPFKSRRKCLKMRSGVSLCAVRKENEVEIMRFETIGLFYSFDSVFGSFSCYGTTEVNPQVGGSTVMRPNHTIATMGDGISNDEVPEKFKRRDIQSLGLDFRYNLTRHVLTMCLRYKIVRASSEPALRQHIASTENTRGRPSLLSRNVTTPFGTTIKKEMEFVVDDVQYSINKDYEENDVEVTCTVVKSNNFDINIGSERVFNIEEVHSLIINYLKTLKS